MLNDKYPPRIKICGMTSVNDALMAANLGADAIGLVFYEPSPRSISIENARNIAQAVGPFVTTVGLFVNADAEMVNKVLETVPLQLLQFHGDEDADYCEQFQRPYMKALRMKPGLDVEASIGKYPSAKAILLDAYRKGVPGGTGEVFDWARVPNTAQSNVPIVLAGGLTPDNVKQAIRGTYPYAVDISGGVESAPGKKDSKKVNQFIHNVKNSLSDKLASTEQP